MNPGTGSSTSPESSGNALSQYSAQEAPLLERGSEGEAVRDVQTFLKNAGMYTGNVDGSFGSNMESAVREFQKSQGLTTDGIVGPDTWEAMTGFSST
jgi:peptidoglycan hydrolase-like protein with peptidoglycan-binding domain